MSKLVTPPEEMYGARVLEFAHVDVGVTHAAESALLVGGKKLRRVPRLAIGQSIDRAEFLLFFCDKNWEPLGVVACKSRDDAKKRAKREYRGIESKWKELDVKARAGKRSIKRSGGGKVLRCSFCKEDVSQVERLFESETARICDKCICELHKSLKKD